MAFLSIDELRTVIPDDVKGQMVESAQIEQIIAEEQAKIASYLQGRYDTEAIFAAEDDKRNLAVLSHLKVMVLACIYTVNGRQLNEVTQHRHNEAMRWLEDVALGKITPQLPRTDADGDGAPDPHIAYGSEPKRTFE